MMNIIPFNKNAEEPLKAKNLLSRDSHRSSEHQGEESCIERENITKTLSDIDKILASDKRKTESPEKPTPIDTAPNQFLQTNIPITKFEHLTKSFRPGFSILYPNQSINSYKTRCALK